MTSQFSKASARMADEQLRSCMVVCAGLACVDMELHACNIPVTRETVTSFGDVSYAAGGSAPQTSRALVALGLRSTAIYPAGDDAHGRALKNLLHEDGVLARPIECSSSSSTALAVLPVFTDGSRGCFVSLGSNREVSAQDFCPSNIVNDDVQAFHFGYPHLIAGVQGKALRELYESVRQSTSGALLSLDVNGADVSERSRAIITPALSVVDLFHANLEEACTISGLHQPGTAASLTSEDVVEIARWFCDTGESSGSIIVCITCGKDGAVVGTGTAERFRAVHRSAYALQDGTKINASGAGDAFVAGSIMGLLSLRQGRPQRIKSTETYFEQTAKSRKQSMDSSLLGMDELAFLADAGLYSSRVRLEASSRNGASHLKCIVMPFVKSRDSSRIAPRDGFMRVHASAVTAEVAQ